MLRREDAEKVFKEVVAEEFEEVDVLADYLRWAVQEGSGIAAEVLGRLVTQTVNRILNRNILWFVAPEIDYDTCEFLFNISYIGVDPQSKKCLTLNNDNIALTLPLHNEDDLIAAILILCAQIKGGRKLPAPKRVKIRSHP